MTPALQTTTPAVATNPDTDAAELIPVLREQIDALDEALLRIVAERARVSRRIQAARISSGGARVELGRERVVHAAYREALGEDGPELAAAVLHLCRGAARG
jgi:chorismate mutase